MEVHGRGHVAAAAVMGGENGMERNGTVCVVYE